MTPHIQFASREVTEILVVLFLSFLIGLEREEHKGGELYEFGGVRTFPLIGLTGYVAATLSGSQLLPLALGFIVVGGLTVVSYLHKTRTRVTAGATTEMSALLTYLLGALIYEGHLWVATAIAVISALMLELKAVLEGLTRKIPPEEVLTFTKFLLLSVVILPILPRQSFTQFQFDPFKTWLIVVLVSAVSYVSYILMKTGFSRGGPLFTAALAGAYSSTVATVSLARRAEEATQPRLFSGAILLASGVMYARLLLLVALLNHDLLRLLALPFLGLAGLAIVGGWSWSRTGCAVETAAEHPFKTRNPLALGPAFLFAALFLAMMVLTRLALAHWGSSGVYGLAAIMGFTDVDPFILSTTQSAGSITSLQVGGVAIVIAAASNNVVKGIYAFWFSDSSTGKQSLALLWLLALLGALPLLWVLR